MLLGYSFTALNYLLYCISRFISQSSIYEMSFMDNTTGYSAGIMENGSHTQNIVFTGFQPEVNLIL